HPVEFGAPVSQHLLVESPDSDCTSHLLGGAVSLGEMDELFPLYSRLHVDSSRSVSELQVLRDSLERERSRRKVCEQQVASLQNKVLQVQQQFTLAVAADRKKDIMIEQLDKTLVKVVEGWRRHDQDRSDEIKLLQDEKQKAETTLHKQKEALSCVEETLNKEQKHNQELQDTNTKLKLTHDCREERKTHNSNETHNNAEICEQYRTRRSHTTTAGREEV
ncbi:putative centrobin-like, partial [Triplophysa rosa]